MWKKQTNHCVSNKNASLSFSNTYESENWTRESLKDSLALCPGKYNIFLSRVSVLPVTAIISSFQQSIVWKSKDKRHAIITSTFKKQVNRLANVNVFFLTNRPVAFSAIWVMVREHHYILGCLITHGTHIARLTHSNIHTHHITSHHTLQYNITGFNITLVFVVGRRPLR